MGNVHIERQGHVAILTIDNPPVNVLSLDMGRKIHEAVLTVGEDDSVLAVVVTGAGDKAFMAGGDIKEFPSYLSEQSAEAAAHAFNATLSLLHGLGKPTISALNGSTLGGGCEVALACDFRIAEEHIQIGFPEVTLGLFPGAGGTQRLPRLIGESRAKELILTGVPITAQTAERIGLVNRVVPTGQAVHAAIQFAAPFATRSLASIRLAKQAIDLGLEGTLEAGLRLEERLFGEAFETEDVHEGVAAFIEKRAPKFKHR